MTDSRADNLKDCTKNCLKKEQTCDKTECRHWINYDQDFNCSLISIYLNGAMTLAQVAERLSLSLVRISQIEKQALKKLAKR